MLESYKEKLNLVAGNASSDSGTTDVLEKLARIRHRF